jgi:hypothetical protein
VNEISKFDELRLKTDGELVQLAAHQLDLGIRAACEALNSADNPAHADGYLPAQDAYLNASRLIRLLSEISADQRRVLELRLEHLRVMVEALSAEDGFTPTPTKEEIARLARAMWEARGCPEGMAERDWFRAEQFLKSRAESSANCVAG